MAGDPYADRKEPVLPTVDGPVYPPVRSAQTPARPVGQPTPVASPGSASQPAAKPAPAAPAPRPIFVSDAAVGPDTLGRAAPLARLSELIAHKGALGPLSIALLGGPGSGKTHALADVVEGAGLLATAALSAPNGPFLPRLVALRLEASDLGDEPEAAIAERLHARISREYPQLAQHAAEEATHASADPRQTARALADALDEARRRLVAERAARDEAANRRARLTETVLYEAPGSQIDSYARANRGRIEPALRGFGFAGADSTADFKGLVHTYAESGGPANRALGGLRSLWAYRGQKKLIVLAILFFLFAWGLDALARDRAWLASLESGGDSVKSVAAWFSGHLGLFVTAAKVADFAGFACLALLVWRAWRFTQPLWRGAKLLDLDVAARKADLERQIAHHAQRVDALTRDADALAARAADAEKRAGGPDRAAQVAPAFMRDGPSRTGQARAYFAALDALVAREDRPAGASPGRFIVALDSVDRLPPDKALAMLTSVASALARPAFALITAFDPHHFDGVDGAAVALSRLVQTPFTLSAADAPGWTAFVEQLAGRATPAPRAKPGASGGTTLDMPLTEPETKLLSALAQLAGPSPRGVNRLVNLYRLARHDAPDDLAAVACMLALRIGGAPAEQQAVERALSSADSFAPFSAPEAGARVAAGLAAAVTAQGGPVSNASARRAFAVARMWSL